MERTVKLVANEGVFEGLAKQNLLFHQCLCELIDNSIAAKKEDEKFRIDIVFAPKDDEDNLVDLYIADNCSGMKLDILAAALQLGKPATTHSRLNEHGFGLKNSLATLSGGNGYWKLWTRQFESNDVYSVEGPFKAEMTIHDKEPLPEEEEFLPPDTSTLIRVTVKLSFIQSVQGRGAPTKDLSTLRSWLIEHLGVLYRGYLEQDPATNDNSGVIVVSIGTNRVTVPPIPVPIGNRKIEYLEVELAGEPYNLEYQHGTLDEVRRDKLVGGEKAKFYYQGNMPAQGIDIRLGKRVIATRQLETIWKTGDGKAQLSRHTAFNDFVGELLIPELPRGVLSTVNNKTDFNLDDPDWVKIFERLNEIRPIRHIRQHSEVALRDKWVDMLGATSPDDHVSKERSVWPTATKIDVYRETAEGAVLIYEIKVGSGAPIHLYQLKMYWDGLAIQNEQPKEALLLVEEFSTTLEEMANMMNELPPPEGTKPYNFKIARLKDKRLIES